MTRLSEPRVAKALPRAITVRMSDVVPESVSWLWLDRIPFGKITILEGDPGLGKSLLTLDLAARLTTGAELPEGRPCHPGHVLILSAEDGLTDTIRPRLDTAGADVSRVSVLTAVRAANGQEEFPSLSRDVEQVEQAIHEMGGETGLLIVDPFMAYLGDSEVNSHRDQDVRRVLAPLAAMAERTGWAIIVVRHLTKLQGSQAIYRGGGSIGISGAARSVLLVAKDAKDPLRRLLASVKCNLSRAPQSLAYRIEIDAKGFPRLAWETGTVDVTADQLLAVHPEGRSWSALGEAEHLLRESLARGPKPEEEVRSELLSRGISVVTYKRARVSLGVESCKVGFDGGWVLSLPEGDQPLVQAIDPLRAFEEGEV